MSAIPASVTIASEAAMLAYRGFFGGAIAHGATYLGGVCETIPDAKASYLAKTITKVIVAVSAWMPLCYDAADVNILSAFYIAPLVVNYLVQTSDLPKEVKEISSYISNVIDITNRIMAVVTFSITAGILFGTAGVFLAGGATCYVAYIQLSERNFVNYHSFDPTIGVYR